MKTSRRFLATLVLSVVLLGASDCDRALKLYQQGVAETKAILEHAATAEEKHSAFVHLQIFLDRNKLKLSSENKKVSQQLRADIFTLNQFLEEFNHKNFDEASCAEYRNHVLFQFKVEPEESKNLMGAPRTMLDFYDLACN